MTVCIGAICEDGKATVVAADKMVTFGAPMSLQTEPPTMRKVVQLNNEPAVLLFSGSVPDGEEVLSEVRKSAKAGVSTANIAKVAKDAYVALKTKRVQEMILGPLLGADFPKFQTLVSQSPSSQILQQILAMVSQHNLQLEILVAGMDSSGNHLFTVSHPGTLQPLETLGYGTIGSGGLHAAVRLALGQQNRQASLIDTVYNVYEAKKAAEVAPGVGRLTDMVIIKDRKVSFVKPEMFEVLEKVHKEKPIMIESEQEELKKVCDECTK